MKKSREDTESINSIYANIDTKCILGKEIKDRKKMEIQSSELTGSDLVKIKKYRAATVCLVLLCFLLLTGAIVLSVFIYTNYRNYTEERHQLLTNITNLMKHRDALINQIQFFIQEDGWTYNQSSFYLMSSEMKNWNESRRYCKERGADLIIINNQQEQDLVLDITRNKEFWIGLTDSEEEGRWKWVGGSNLDSGFWASGEPNGGRKENCVLTHLINHPELLGWLDHHCDYVSKWICEKSIFPTMTP